MTPDNRHIDLVENHHGVLLNISGHGVFIIGEAGIGKSSLALDYLHAGHSLIADDCVDFKSNQKKLVTGYSPPMLAGLLHTRELGLIALSDIFDTSTWQTELRLDYVIRLQKEQHFPSSLSISSETYTICKHAFPLLTLDINNPAALSNRINTWLIMQTTHNMAETTLIKRQQSQMERLQ